MFDFVSVFVLGFEFLLVALVTWRVGPEMGFHGASRGLVAFCVAALSVVGLLHAIPAGEGDGESTMVSFMLIPYAALGLSILVVLILLMLGFGGQREGENSYRGREFSSEEGQVFDGSRGDSGSGEWQDRNW